ncbi:SDR family NAD(P)-dependent oxidoreductase [Qingshengfaniella alkalisoli]|uniref:SDR family oxidoreductase n=1 Tax=Qingshengfaniella alkalisoli TaxID=2599296 RepID=A0A5B8IRM2_9RHOB|nr:SDR family oxidoreductase [Qingshengfaniella alkalisoli]QDY68852.1 SDR family oxidoreductase [Qingshengfaniella alkalisoli]
MGNATFHDLKGKSVFITGGGSGIGAALTEAFIAQGAKVAFVQRSDATAFCDDIEAKHGNRPQFIACDITDISALQSAIDQASDFHGPIDVLVNNAANDDRHNVEDVTEEYWDRCQSINLKPYFFACQAVAPAMRKAGRGAIVNFSSITYMMGAPGLVGYSTANAGINGMSRSLARELGADGIRVNALMPGWVLTERQKDKWASPEALAAHLERQCLKEHLVPSDIAEGVLFLASDTSRMMTGQALVIDGGFVVTG